MIGTKLGHVSWPERTHYPLSDLPDDGKRWRSFRDAVEGLPLKPSGLDWHNPRNPSP